MSNNQKLKIANKLYCRFGHVSPEKLKKLIKISNINYKDYNIFQTMCFNNTIIIFKLIDKYKLSDIYMS